MSRAFKRVFDFAVAGILFVLLAPLMALIGLAIRVKMGSPILFRQTRAGFQGRPFALLKFRTMSNAYHARGESLADAFRITRLGQWLRRLSFDELPQLWNVLRGEMSVVGPRPLLMKYLELYSPLEMHRHDVKPGITGWAQINGRNALTWEEKFSLDLWYVEHWSLALDARILLQTLWRVIQGGGISQEGNATMPEFMGSNTSPS